MSDPGPIKFPPPKPSDAATKLTLRRRRTAAARPTLDVIDASAAARESINALFSASRTPFTAKPPEATKLLELERTLRQLELSLAERQRVITDTEIRLAEKERDVAEVEALLQAREQLIAVSRRSTSPSAEINPETKQALDLWRGAFGLGINEFYRQTECIAEKIVDGWLRTGDEAAMDEDGYVYFSSRTDDVITSSGYRIGPSEIEDCLAGHPDVAIAAVIGVPDPIRTEAVKAFVVLRDGAERAGLAEILIARVRMRISPHLAPREVEFVDRLPMTATGKIQRRLLKAAEESSPPPSPPPDRVAPEV